MSDVAAACHAWPLADRPAYDGDTFHVLLPGLPAELQPVAIRILGLDAPEMRGRCARETALAHAARDRLRAILSASGDILFCDIRWDKYGGRIDACVLADRCDVASILIGEGLARPYAGGRRRSRCDGTEAVR